MQNKIRFVLFLVFLFCSIGSVVFAGADSSDVFCQGSLDSAKPYSRVGLEWDSLLPENTVVLQEIICDITGDGVADRLILAGSKETISANYFRNLALAFMDGATGKKDVQSLSMAGYSPQIKPVFLLSKETPAFLVSAPTGGSGGIVDNRIVSFAGGLPQILFNANNNKGLSIEGIFLPDYQVRITFLELGQSITFDRTYAKADYQRLGLYTEDGIPTGKKGGTPWIDPFSALTVVDSNQDGFDELRGIQQLSGAYHADRLGTVTSIWFYENGQWRIGDILVSAKLVKRANEN